MEFPDEIITVGGHLDAWELGEGAHDDGGGCIQSIEVLRLFLTNGIRPKHTIRAVMFMDEEVAQRGGQAYAKEAFEAGEKHIAAMESDLVYLGMMPDNQRYFRFHHSAFDTFEQVDRREMQMGAASMAAMVYLFDQYGL